MPSMENMRLPEDLVDMRKRIGDLRLASLAYAGIGITDETFQIIVVSGDDTIVTQRAYSDKEYVSEIIAELGEVAAQNNIKIVAASIVGGSEYQELGERMWLEEDIVPLFFSSNDTSEDAIKKAALDAASKFNEHGLIDVTVSGEQSVDIAWLTTKQAYEARTEADIWKKTIELAKEFSDHDTPLIFINATTQGGGVALMRHALLRFLREIGVKVSWHVVRPNSDVFDITKSKFHNVLQAVAREHIVLTERDKDVYNAWIQENFELLRTVIEKAKVIVIDDPQPSGLIPLIKEANPEVKIIYRSHIHLDRDLLAKEGSPQHTTWEFLWQNIQLADVFISHPVEQFVPYEAVSKTVSMPATTDLLDGLNKPLSDTQMAYYKKLFNKILLEHDQEPLSDERPYFIQIARFDPSKGIPDVIESYWLLREKLSENDPVPQLVLVGHGSIDDPDGVPVYNMTLHLLQEDRYRDIASDIKVVRLHHNDQILNALLRGCRGALQLSHKEGFEVKVSEAIEKGKPVVAYKSGGIPLQIQEGESGFLVEKGKVEEVADRLYTILTDDALYEKMSEYATRCVNPNYFTVYNAAKWLYLANTLLEDKEIAPGKSVGELASLPAARC